MTECEPGMLGTLLLIFTLLLTTAFLFLLTQYNTLVLIRPENRRMHPMLVWLQLIPLLGICWQFYVSWKIADAIRDQLKTPGPILLQIAGILYPSLFCISWLPVPEPHYFTAAGLSVWIVYWGLLLYYRMQLKNNLKNLYQ